MPVVKGKDIKGPYYRYGKLTKYYYVSGNKKSRSDAKNKAIKQAAAVHINKRQWDNYMFPD